MTAQKTTVAVPTDAFKNKLRQFAALGARTVTLTPEEGRLLLRAARDQDLETAILADSAAGAELTLPLELLAATVRSVKSDEIELNFADKQLELQAGSFEATLVAYEQDPLEMVLEGDPLAALPADRLRRALLATNQTDSAFTLGAFAGLQLEFYPKRLRVAGSDGYRLAICEIEGARVDQPEREPVLLPRQHLNAINALLEEAGEAEVTLALAGNRLVLHTPAARYSAPLYEGRYPDYERVIPAETPNVLTVATKPLKQALKRLAALTDNPNKPVHLHLEEGAPLHLETESDYASGAENLHEDAGYQGEPLKLAVNASYLLAALEPVGETARFAFQQNSQQSPFTLNDAGDPEGYLAVLVPLRV